MMEVVMVMLQEIGRRCWRRQRGGEKVICLGLFGSAVASDYQRAAVCSIVTPAGSQDNSRGG